MSSSLQDRVVAAIGDTYELGNEIGRGGMSVVYRARDLRLNRVVALKVLPPEMAYDPAIRMRFTREAQTSAQLSHAHIVPIYDVGERDGIAYFVMAVITGGSLADLLAREPRPPLDEVRRILCEIADGLAFAHQRGVIHRDIKPDNILLDADSGRAMVTDFGIARAIEAGTRLTVTGNAVGTPTYMSPEQAIGEREVDGRSDIYSLGVLGYQMLTGRVPFSAGNSMALLLKHVSESPTPIAELRPDVPKAFVAVVERAMQKAPDDRWPTAAAMRDALSSRELAAASWRSEHREPVRYPSPRPQGARPGSRATSPRRGTPSIDEHEIASPVSSSTPSTGGIVLVPPHLAALTPEQLVDLRLWNGHVHLLDRIKAMRRYLLLTMGMTVLGITGFVIGAEEIPPLLLSPIVPFLMSRKLMRRGRSLRASGLQVRRVLTALRAARALPTPPTAHRALQLEQLAPRDVLESAQGRAIRRAAEDRAAILEVAATLPERDRALVPELASTVDALVQRVAQLAQMLHRLDQSVNADNLEEIDSRIARAAQDSGSADADRRVGLLRRQRESLDALVQRRAALARQLENAGLALGNLRLDLIKLRSSGLQSAMSDVSSATQEVRALSRDIDAMLEADAEVREL